MLTKYTLTAKDDIKSICRKFNVKDQKTLAQLPQNKALFASSKKFTDLKAGDVIWVPDPKAKCYIMKVKGKQVVLTEAEWKRLQQDLKKQLTYAVDRIEGLFNAAETLHDMQTEVNEKHYIVAFFCSNWIGSKGNEPVAKRKAAKAAVKKLRQAVSGGNFKAVEQSMRKCQKAVDDYGRGVDEWREQLTGSAGNWITGLTIASEASYMFLGAVAMTAAAPASVGVAALYAAGVGGGSALLKSSINETGRGLAGEKVTLSNSLEKIAWKTLEGCGYGAIFGAAGAKINQWAVPRIAGLFKNPGKVSGLVQSVFSRSPVAKTILERSKKTAVKQLIAKAVQRRALSEPMKAAAQKLIEAKAYQVGVKATIAFVLRTGAGPVKKAIVNWTNGQLDENRKIMLQIAKKASKSMTEHDLVDELVRRIEKSPALQDAMEAVLKENRPAIEAQIERELGQELDRFLDSQRVPEEAR